MYLSKLQFEIVQAILCQSDSIFHQLSRNMTRDCWDISSELYKYVEYIPTFVLDPRGALNLGLGKK